MTMKRFPPIPNEQRATHLAAKWLQSVDDGFQRAGITAQDEAAQPLLTMDRDLRVWEAAARRGWHNHRSLDAAGRVLHWLGAFTDMQRTANRRRRSVTRGLSL